jgi:hypothetical protein
MNKNYLWIIGSITLLLIAINAQAFYFTIQLQNGNEMKTAQYWEDGDKISFYARSGTVSLPKAAIKNIIKVDGALESEPVYLSTDLLTDETEEPDYESPLLEDKPGFGAEQTEEFKADLRDRLSIIGSNLENLERNKEMFTRQREGYEQDREKARERIAALDKETLLSPDERAERTQLENAKIQDADTKIARVDDQIRNNARLIDAQNNMKARLEKELAGLTQ